MSKVENFYFRFVREMIFKLKKQKKINKWIFNFKSNPKWPKTKNDFYKWKRIKWFCKRSE